MASSSFTDNPWLASLLGVLLRDGIADTDFGRSDVLNLGEGCFADWDDSSKELTLTATSGFTIEETAADLTVTAGGGTFVLLDYDLSAVTYRGTAIADGESLMVDVRVEAWRNADEDVVGYCDMTVHLVYHDGSVESSAIKNTPSVEQTVSSSWEAGLSIDATITDDTTLRITAVSTTTTVRCAALLSHRKPRTRTTV